MGRYSVWLPERRTISTYSEVTHAKLLYSHEMGPLVIGQTPDTAVQQITAYTGENGERNEVKTRE